MEQQLHDLLSTSESDLESFSYMEIGRIHKLEPILGNVGRTKAKTSKFARILEETLHRIDDKELLFKSAA